ncbi:unnamed protein product [Hyaloperonospora brassicae]|uniref:Uncharacterized protein n=1 Tax=Hyaloperonospora brassicae TaxID=162125 RepID=A0AAV0TWM0_HYABA|nr:unnamed protein product [Hyaloperonospora brassicae]
MPSPHDSDGAAITVRTKRCVEKSNVVDGADLVGPYYEEADLELPRQAESAQKGPPVCNVSGSLYTVHARADLSTSREVDGEDSDRRSVSVNDLLTFDKVRAKAREPENVAPICMRTRRGQEGRDSVDTCRGVSAAGEEPFVEERGNYSDMGSHGGKILDVPAYLARPGWEHAALKQKGDEWLQQIVALCDVPSLGTKDDEVSGVQELWSYSSDPLAATLLCPKSNDVECHEVRFRLLKPQRIQCDWYDARRSGQSFMYEESSKMFHTVNRAHAQAKLLVREVVVPNVFEGEWGRRLYSIRPADDVEEIQQLLLPCELVRHDEVRVLAAPSTIVALADAHLHSLQRTDISLTKASMNTPCVWNHAAALNGLAKLVAEKLSEVGTQSKLPASYTCGSASVPLHADDNRENPATPPATKKNEDQSDPSSRASLARLLLANKASPVDLSTDYLLSDKFLRCAWSERSPDGTSSSKITSTNDVSPDPPKEDSTFNQLLQQIARPALWDLMRKRMLRVDESSFQQALNGVSLEALEAIIYKQCHEVKKMRVNPSAFASTDIIEACATLRQAAWLHTLRIISMYQVRGAAMMAAFLARILHSAKYKLMLGSSNWKDLCTLLEPIGKRGVPVDTSMIDSGGQEVTSDTTENGSVPHPLQKRQKLMQMEKENVPVRVLCSVPFLQQDELLDELCTEQQIYFIERDLPPPIDILIDERNCICVVTDAILQVEANMKSFIFSLARLQIQFQKCWLVIALCSPPTANMEDAMTLFLSALVQFRVEVHVLTSFSCEEAGCFVRTVIDQCAEAALEDRRILPRVWFDRPFLLEEESQFERFLVSTRIVNNYAAQSLLHKICMEDLFTKDLTELKLLAQNAVTDHQLELLWRFVQQGHGLNGAT